MRGGAWRRAAAAALCLAAASFLLAGRPWLAGPAWAGAGTTRAAGVVRLHVVAHSDGDFDQAVKLRVRDRVLAELAAAGLPAAAATPAENLALLEASAERLTAVAAAELQASGAPYGVRVEVGHHPYEARSYRSLTLPAGVYPSVRIVLGAGRGANWWCVLYPIMCTVEVEPPPGTVVHLPGGEAILIRPGAAPPPVEVRLALLEWARRWPSLRQAVERLEAVLIPPAPAP